MNKLIWLVCCLLMMMMMMTHRQCHAIPQLHPQQRPSLSGSVNLCDNTLDQSTWLEAAAERYLTNHVIETGIQDVRGPVNASSSSSSLTFQDCLRLCCDKIDCNYAFLKDSHVCFLISCHDDHTCKPVPNAVKSKTDPVDHLIHVRSVVDSKNLIKMLVSKEEKELLKMESELKKAGVLKMEKNPECIPTVMVNNNNSPCPVNEVCMKKKRSSGGQKQVVEEDGEEAVDEEHHECVCPSELSMHRVDGVCREYLPNMPDCMMNLNECGENNNNNNNDDEENHHQECVVFHAVPDQPRSRHGTCQCRVGFRRDMASLRCVPQRDASSDGDKKMTDMPKNSRRRPSPPVSSADEPPLPPPPSSETASVVVDKQASQQSPAVINSQSLWEQILKKLGVAGPSSNKKNDNESPTHKILSSLGKLQVETNEQLGFTSSTAVTPTTTSTTSTTTTTTTTSTDPPNVHTNNLFADAGHDFHVYYPSRVCVLNGNATKFMPKSADDRIVRWHWTKADSSPAFGQFVGTNEGQVVMYEQMVEGVYKFMLRVWTSSHEYSQSSVHVYVHSTLNSNRTTATKSPSSSSSASSYRQENELNENVILIELDVEPNMFSEFLKERFLMRFQQMLDQHRQQFRLSKPRVILLNTRIAAPLDYSTKSSVVLELIVTDVIDANVVIDWDVPEANKNGMVVDDRIDLVGENRHIVDNSRLIRLMRRHQNVFRFSFHNLNSVWEYLEKAATNMNRNKDQHRTSSSGSMNSSPGHSDSSSSSSNQLNYYSMLDSLDVKVLSVSKLTCTSDFYASERHVNSYNCSNHGKCDFNSHKCICNKYWMPNLYLKYFDYESDLTNGNNCEYNIPLVVVLSILFVLVVLTVIKLVFKYFFYYAFCCCLCRRGGVKGGKVGRAFKNRLGRKLNGGDTSYLDDDDDLNTSETNDRAALIGGSSNKSSSKVKTLKKPFGNFSNSSKHQYSLLRNQDNDSMTWRGPRSGEQLNDDDEDVIYDESSVKHNRSYETKPAASQASAQPPVKKYSVI